MVGSVKAETVHHSLPHKIPSDDRGEANLKWVVENWISLGADPAKLNIGW